MNYTQGIQVLHPSHCLMAEPPAFEFKYTASFRYGTVGEGVFSMLCYAEDFWDSGLPFELVYAVGMSLCMTGILYPHLVFELIMKILN